MLVFMRDRFRFITLKANYDKLRFNEIVKKTGKAKKTIARNLPQIKMGLIEKQKPYFCIVVRILS